MDTRVCFTDYAQKAIDDLSPSGQTSFYKQVRHQETAKSLETLYYYDSAGVFQAVSKKSQRSIEFWKNHERKEKTILLDGFGINLYAQKFISAEERKTWTKEAQKALSITED